MRDDGRVVEVAEAAIDAPLGMMPRWPAERIGKTLPIAEERRGCQCHVGGITGGPIAVAGQRRECVGAEVPCPVLERPRHAVGAADRKYLGVDERLLVEPLPLGLQVGDERRMMHGGEVLLREAASCDPLDRQSSRPFRIACTRAGRST
jgi:hypothetical protein